MKSWMAGVAALMVWAPAQAQEPSTDAVCPNKQGTISVRVSQLKPGGTLEGFMDAVRDHERWIKAHGGAKDTLKVARIVAFDRPTNKSSLSGTEIATVHWRAIGGQPNLVVDDAWKAFRAKYQANATVVEHRILCIQD